MKKIIMLLMLGVALLATNTAKSQASFTGTSTNSTRAILNSTEDTALYTTSVAYHTISIEAKVTRSSGTMAGKIYVWSSVSGNSWNLRDSVTLTNTATQYKTWNFTGAAHKYWMLIQNGGTTVAGILNGKISGAGQ